MNKRKKDFLVSALVFFFGSIIFALVYNMLVQEEIDNIAGSDNIIASNTDAKAYPDNDPRDNIISGDEEGELSNGSITGNMYLNGNFKSKVYYHVSRGTEFIEVEVALKNDVIQEVFSVHSLGDNRSASYQKGFDEAYKDLVIGKDITELNLSRVAGASDTTDAFMDALENVKNEAKI